MNKRDIYKDVLFGVAAGDALGVPVEFKSRNTILEKPVKDMLAYGTHFQPAGTFSDDSSLTFCLAEALTKPYDLQTIAANFVAWVQQNYWTPRGDVFDIGIATSQAIAKLARGVEPTLAGGSDESSNGNGALMRILPLLFYLHDKPIDERFQLTKDVSSLTHAHIRSVIGCFYYLEFARHLLAGNNTFDIYTQLQTDIPRYLKSIGINAAEINIYDRLLMKDIAALPAEEIYSSGYVLHTLEAAIWCIMTTGNYADAVLKAVNLGEDTDTTGAVTGGLAGLLYGYENIPSSWIQTLARRKDITDLSERLQIYFNSIIF